MEKLEISKCSKSRLSLQEHQQRTATGKERKAWRKASEWASSAKPSGDAVGKSALPHRDPCSSLKPVGNRWPNGYGNESRRERKGREEGILLKVLLSLTRIFYFTESIASSWASYTTGAFCTTFQTAVWVYSHAVSHVFGMTLRASFCSSLVSGTGLAEVCHLQGVSQFPSTGLPRLCAEVSYQTRASFTVLTLLPCPPQRLFSCMKILLRAVVVHG